MLYTTPHIKTTSSCKNYQTNFDLNHKTKTNMLFIIYLLPLLSADRIGHNRLENAIDGHFRARKTPSQISDVKFQIFMQLMNQPEKRFNYNLAKSFLQNHQKVPFVRNRRLMRISALHLYHSWVIVFFSCSLCPIFRIFRFLLTALYIRSERNVKGLEGLRKSKKFVKLHTTGYYACP